MMKKQLFPCILITALTLGSCSTDDGPIPTNPRITVPDTYTFSRKGITSVDFSGQTARIQMGEETLAAFKDFEKATETSLKAMYDHQAGENDFLVEDLNASGKNLKNKTAASEDYFSANTTEAASIRATFDNYISAQVNEVFPNRDSLAAPGRSGQIADGTSARYVNANGLEYDQAFAKGLLGAVMTDQILNNYLSPAVLDAGTKVADNDNELTETEKTYTTMEHNWDEAYGYVYGSAADPADPNKTIGGDDPFLNEYVGAVSNQKAFSSMAKEIFDAFKLGRAAIVAKEYGVRDEQTAVICKKLSEVIAIRAVHYLQKSKDKIVSGAVESAFHGLSEAYGFIYSLRFTKDPKNGAPYFSKAEVDGLTAQLLHDNENGFWTVTPQTLDAVSEAIAAKFEFTVNQATN